jgi:CheY-like chemotaxis protein/HPt (histidine-containing phosphotransfer) domain-containing protein
VGAAIGRSAPHRVAIDAAGAVVAKQAAAAGRGQRVLLAEDHPINREVITRQLLKLGYACECAEDGQQAWEMLQAEGTDYAMLLTDCHMPRLDGYELTTRLRAQEAARGLARLPIVALTANALQGEAERCLALGMDAYLSKPLQLEDLREALSRVLQGGPAGGDADADADAEEKTEADAEEETDSAAPPYARLMALCGGDAAKVAKLVRVFVSATEEDMKAMDRAAEAADPVALRQLAHRMTSACHQLDEDDAVSAFRTVEHQAQAPGALQPQTLAAYRAARSQLESVMLRAQDFARSNA